jgi:pantoate ligase / CMP/dCMP kinase
LIERARRENHWVVVSIFVNPLQFGPQEDFEQYPRQLEQDRQLCAQAGVDAIFAPTVAALYGNPEPTQVVPPPSMTAGLCGRSRPGHFQGVATVVLKLFEIVQPERAYFGQKDAQQLAILRRMVVDLDLPVEVVGCPIVRESNGLALSSRNQYLQPQDNVVAAGLFRGLQAAHQAFMAGERDAQRLIAIAQAVVAQEATLGLDYLELVHPDTLEPLSNIESTGLMAIAARVGSTRLIDNMMLSTQRPILAIDGPAGAGKSTVTRRVAQALDLLYLDTGAMYRAVTWLVLQSGLDLTDTAAIAELVATCELKLEPGNGGLEDMQVWMNGQLVTDAIRQPEVTGNVSAIAAQSAVRKALVQQQQRYGQRGGVVAEGRDIGTHVFPEAGLKIFLTASIQERARRRYEDLQARGIEPTDLLVLEQEISQRDYLDSHREVAPLTQATDAVLVVTDGLSIGDVTDKIVTLYRDRYPTL